MKKFLITTLLVSALAVILPARPALGQIEVNVTIGGFYDELAPYGRWVDCRYGHCWVPRRVTANWQPYTNGQWVYTEYGWTWMSDDPWGGDPYHYGTWTVLDRYGWSWVPGTIWAPAWVTWSYSNNYVGWAPLPPTVVFGASGYSGRAVVVSSTQYVFVPMNRFSGTNVTSVRVSAQQNSTIFRQTTPATRFAVSGGVVRNTAIPVATVQRAAGIRIETRSISEARATPRSMTAGTTGRSRQVAIVAPAREVQAAVAARSHGVSRSSAPSGEKGRAVEVSRQSGSPMPESRQGSGGQHATVKPERHREASEAPGRAEVRPSEPRHEAAPPDRGQKPPARAEAHPRSPGGPAESVQPPPPQQGAGRERPVEKEKKEDKH